MSEQEKMNQAEIQEEKAEASVPEKKAPKADKPKKAKSDKDKKPGIGERISRYFRELKGELKKVSWPTRQDTLKKTGVVIACCIAVGLIVWIFDSIANQVIEALLSLTGH